MDGSTTIRTLQKMNPQIKIIAASGLASNDKVAEAEAAWYQSIFAEALHSERIIEHH